MRAAAHSRADLVEFFPLPWTNSGAFWFPFNIPQSFYISELTLGFLSITDKRFSFFPSENGKGNVMSEVLRINMDEYTSRAEQSAARQHLHSSVCTSAEMFATHIYYSHFTDDKVNVHSQHMEKNEDWRALFSSSCWAELGGGSKQESNILKWKCFQKNRQRFHFTPGNWINCQIVST